MDDLAECVAWGTPPVFRHQTMGDGSEFRRREWLEQGADIKARIMQFLKLGEFFAVVRITGITHHLLKLRLAGSGEQTTVDCECLPAVGKPAVGKSPVGGFDEDALVASVLDGVRQANDRLGSAYRVTHIQYVEDDTPPESTYGALAMRIVEHLHSGRAWAAGGH